MALNTSMEEGFAPFELGDSDIAPRNDAFSFWKLPEQWREALESSIDSSAEEAEHFLLERYLSDEERRPPTRMKTYYTVKKFIPEAVRHRLNSIVIGMRRRREFPRWPCESALLDYWRSWLNDGLTTLGVEDGWHIGFWPRGAGCAIVLTHDVESPLGMARMERMADIEEKHGFRSSWNFPLAQYPIDWDLAARLRNRGFEIGAHGLSHDGRLFRSENDFRELRPLLEALAGEHGLRGFRAPSTLRRAEWIAATDFDFDLSFSDTDPYEPQPGGTCSQFPFFLGDMIELPYTVPQDHTLINLLRRIPLPLWSMKARWIASLGGMILTLTHPDYCGLDPYLGQYEELLKLLKDIENAWRALPSQVADWWRRRNATSLSIESDRPTLSGPASADAVAWRISNQPLAARG